MMFVKFLPDGTISQEILEKGHHYVEVALNEVPLFIRKGKAIPVADVAQTVKDINPATIRMIGYEGAEYDCKFCSNGTPILKLAVHPF